MDIKDCFTKQASLCKYTLEIVACMMMTGQEYSGLDIRPKTSIKNTDTKDMIRITWYKDNMKQREMNPQQ